MHRQLASGLSCPVGFKNGTAGNVKIAVDAIGAARSPHHFLGVTKDGQAGIFRTTGNLDCHVILRGGDQPNYGAQDVAKTGALLEAAKLPPRVMIDFSHANSSKQHERQVLVGEDVAGQIEGGDRRIVGVMIESNLVAGRQDVKPGQPRVYGQSITGRLPRLGRHRAPPRTARGRGPRPAPRSERRRRLTDPFPRRLRYSGRPATLPSRALR